MDSKFEKWNELPPEMRLECVKWMSFKSRMRLRGASKSDKSLVEFAPKYHFDSVTVIFGDFDMATVEFKKAGAEAENFKLEDMCNPKIGGKAENLTAHLLKFASADDFEFADHHWKELMGFLNKIGHLKCFEFKNVELYSGKLMALEMFAEKCENPEKVAIRKTSEFKSDESLDLLIDIPAIANAKVVQLDVDSTCNSHRNVNSLIAKWGQRNAELGTTLQLAVNDPNLFSKLSNNLKNELIYKKPNEIRLRSDHNSKHILMRQVQMHDEKVYVSLVVISADQKESEYEKNDQWTEEVREQHKKAARLFFQRWISSMPKGRSKRV